VNGAPQVAAAGRHGIIKGWTAMEYLNMDHDDELGEERDDEVVSEQQRKVKKPKRWKVLLHNDDYTTMDFVVHVLTIHFRKPPAEATQVMLQVHHRGVGIAGVYPKDEAHTKVEEVTQDARANGMPLLVTAEKE
jgi:ATP-dependent Clp protease adaptor protein ClpS